MPDSTAMAHLREAGMQKCISLDVSNSFNAYGMYFHAVFLKPFPTLVAFLLHIIYLIAST